MTLTILLISIVLSTATFIFLFCWISDIEKKGEAYLKHSQNEFGRFRETIEGLKCKINGLSEKSYGQDSFIVDLQNEVKSKITHADLDAQKNYLEMKIDSLWKNLGENPSVDTVMDQIYRRVSENVFKETKDRHESIMSGLKADLEDTMKYIKRVENDRVVSSLRTVCTVEQLKADVKCLQKWRKKK